MADLVVRILAKNLTKQGVDQASTEFKKLETAVAQTSQRIKMFGLVAAAGAAAAVYHYGQFDKKVHEIGTLLNNVTKDDIQKMGEEIKVTSVKYAQSLDVMAKARYDIISAGFTDAAASASVLEQAAKLAVGGVAQVSETALSLTKTLNAYVMSADEAQRASDVMFTTVRLGQTTIPELASSLGNVVAIAKVAGLRLEDLGASMATITAGGLDTAMASVALRGALTALASPAKEASQAMEAAGISLKKFDDGTIDLVETMRQFVGMDFERLKEMIPDVRAANAIAVMATNFQKLSTNVNEFKNVAGATDKAVNLMSESAGFNLDQLKVKFSVLVEEIGKMVYPIVSAFTDFVTWLGKLDSATKAYITTIGIATGAIYLLRAAIVAAFGPIGILYGLIGTLAAAYIAYAAKSEDAADSTDTFTESIVTSSGQIRQATVDLKGYREEVQRVARIQSGPKQEQKFAASHETKRVEFVSAHVDVDTKPATQSVEDMISNIKKIVDDGMANTGKKAQSLADRLREMYNNLTDKDKMKENVLSATEAMDRVWISFYDGLTDKEKAEVDRWTDMLDKEQDITDDKLATRMELENMYWDKQEERRDAVRKRDLDALLASRRAEQEINDEYFTTDYELQVRALQDKFNLYDSNWRSTASGQQKFYSALDKMQQKYLLGYENNWHSTALRISKQWVYAFEETMVAPLTNMFNQWYEATTNDFAKFMTRLLQIVAETVVRMVAEWAALSFIRWLGLPFSSGGIISAAGGSFSTPTIAGESYSSTSQLASSGTIVRNVSNTNLNRYQTASTGTVVKSITNNYQAASQGTIVKFVPAQSGALTNGFDSVPILARPGEAIIPTEVVRQNQPLIRQLISGADVNNVQQNQGNTIINQFDISISAVDARGVEDLMMSAAFRNRLVKMVNDDFIRLSANGNPVRGE